MAEYEEQGAMQPGLPQPVLQARLDATATSLFA